MDKLCWQMSPYNSDIWYWENQNVGLFSVYGNSKIHISEGRIHWKKSSWKEPEDETWLDFQQRQWSHEHTAKKPLSFTGKNKATKKQTNKQKTIQ